MPMHNPTRRVKRFNRPLSSTTRSTPLLLYQLPETSAPSEASGEEHPAGTGSNYGRLRQTAQLDAIHGAMLVALIVITLVLYIILWKLERSSFVSVPMPNFTRTVGVASASYGNLEATPTLYSSVVLREGLVPGLSEGAKPFDSRIIASWSKPGCTTCTAWPPPVTHVPEEHDTDAPAENLGDRTHEKLLAFDSTYCNDICRFILPVRIGEQESKARIHFTQLLILARQLNRTMVLPNVGKSRMSICSQWPFGAYYDTNEFAYGGDSPGSWPVMDFGQFTKWVDERPVPPSSFVVSMESIPQDRRDGPRTQTELEDVPFIVEEAEVDPKVLSCLESKLARLRPSIPEVALSISFDSRSFKMESDASTHLVRLLSKSLDVGADSDLDLMAGARYGHTPQYANSSYLSLPDIDILVVDYDLRHPLFTASTYAGFNLHYTPALYDLADRLSDNLGPFVGVHWRLENVPVQNLAWCAASLVSTLGALLKDDVAGKNMRHVWLATDHPRPLRSFTDSFGFPLHDGWRMTNDGRKGMEGSIPQEYGPLRKSGTFHALSSEHDDAIRTLAEAFRTGGGDLGEWKLTDLSEQLGRYPYIEGRIDVNEALLSDSGVYGILDKLVVVQARVFVSGSTECSKTSSFSKQVIEARQESFKAGQGKGAINVVEYFGEW